MVDYQFTGLTPVRDATGNVTGFKIAFNATDSDHNALSGSVPITTKQFIDTAGDVNKINALIAPAVQALTGTAAETK